MKRHILALSLVCLTQALSAEPTEHLISDQARLRADESTLPPALQCTPLASLLRKNGKRLPSNDAEWASLFAEINGTGPDIYFSTSNAQTDLLNPRRIFTAKSNASKEVNEEAFYGRLFVAVGKNENGNRVAEFITQAATSGHYLFGTIDPTRKPPVRVDALNDCKECHKTLGPLYTIYPWTNSSANFANQVALIGILAKRDGEPYRTALREIDTIIGDLRKELGDRQLEALRKFGAVTLDNQYEPVGKAGREIAKKMIERIRRNETLMNLKYQGLPVFRSFSETYEKGIYRHGGTGAHDLHEIVGNVQSATAIAQALEYLRPEDRGRFLDELTTISVKNKAGQIEWHKEWAAVPGWHSSLLSDPGFGAGQTTTINAIDSFFVSVLVDSDKALRPLLKLHGEMSKAKSADAPKLTGIDPRNSANYDPRGQGKLFSQEEGEHSLLGISDRTRQYFKSIIESRKASVDEALRYALRSKWVTELNEKGVIPHSSQAKVAIMKGLGEYFLKRGDDSVLSIPAAEYLSQPELECLKYLQLPQKPGESCVRCHGSESYHYRYLNDLSLWEKDLKAGNTKARTLLAYLKGHSMPPPHTPEDYAFKNSANEKSLREFIEQHP